ncbi:MAG: endonuclease III [Euryarchaeota archaeon]|nr:endonuclease III [Euryarchaeota archaeon]
MAGAKASKIRSDLKLIGGDIEGHAFPGADDLHDPEWPTDPFHVLMATVLSHRTKDANTHRAAKQLFERYSDPRSIADADPSEIEDLVRPSGFYKVKARGLQKICKELVERFDGQVPGTMDELLTLPMVGRKTANCVLSYGFKKDGLCVDVHVHRISNRIGWVSTKHPDDTELELKAKVPKELWCDINSMLVRFGQRTCLPRNPRCSRCPLLGGCDFGSSVISSKD